MDEIAADLVNNFDLNLVPTSDWTMKAKGSKRVEVIGNIKRQLTAVLAGTFDGDFLPPRYQGTTPCCLPK